MTHSTIKRIALIFMIIDHIGAYIPGAPVWFRYIGRISAPLFVFCCVESLEHTHSRKAFVLRLYIASLVMSFGNVILYYIVGFHDGIHTSNMFCTLFISSVAVILFDKWKVRGLLLFLGYQMLCGGIFIICEIVENNTQIWIPNSIWYLLFNISGFMFLTEYGITFILLFFVMYYVKDIKFFLSGLVVMCSYCTWRVSRIYMSPDLSAMIYLGDYQYLMIFSLPLMLLYNGKKGKGSKYFYYIFYPVHLWILFCVNEYLTR